MSAETISKMADEWEAEFGVDWSSDVCSSDLGGLFRHAQEWADTIVIAGHEVVRATAPVHAVLADTACQARHIHRRSGGKMVPERADIHEITHFSDHVGMRVAGCQPFARIYVPRRREGEFTFSHAAFVQWLVPPAKHDGDFVVQKADKVGASFAIVLHVGVGNRPVALRYFLHILFRPARGEIRVQEDLPYAERRKVLYGPCQVLDCVRTKHRVEEIRRASCRVR